MRAARPGSITKRPNTYEKGRTCPECSAILSRYNSGPFCTAHEDYNPIRYRRMRGRLPKIDD